MKKLFHLFSRRLSSTHKVGRFGEGVAAAYLKKQGFRVIARNLHLSHDEIDLIVENATDLVFVEVKTRAVSREKYDAEASELSPLDNRPSSCVNAEKKDHLLCAAYAYLAKHPCAKQPRIDVVEVLLEKDADGFATRRVLDIRHIPAAVSRSDRRRR